MPEVENAAHCYWLTRLILVSSCIVQNTSVPVASLQLGASIEQSHAVSGDFCQTAIG
jgi:hypothetical protein